MKIYICFAAGIILLNQPFLVITQKKQNVEKPFTGTRDTAFDWTLVKNIFEQHQGNAIFSTFFVKVMLTLLYEATGVASLTKQELNSALKLNSNIESTRSTYSRYQGLTEDNNPECSISLATRMLVDDFIEVLHKYEISLEYHYNITIEKFSSTDSAKSAESVNNWFSQATKGRITGVVTADLLTETVISVANANVLKALWVFPFPKGGPQQKFSLADGKTVEVPFMEQEQNFYYQQGNGLDAQVLRLPLRGGIFSMYFILPFANTTVDSIVTLLAESNSRDMFSNLVETKVHVMIPKFRFDSAHEFKEALQKVGIHQVFSENAALPLLARGRGTRNKVRLSNLIQKSGIVINEQGIEAASVAGVQVLSKIGGDQLPMFHANRPFLFFIEDDAQGTMLFAGKVENPSE